jgi:hypothetical protein
MSAGLTQLIRALASMMLIKNLQRHRYGHEYGQHRSTKNGMVGEAEVRDLERWYFVRKFSFVLKVTSRHTRPMGYVALPGTTP